MVIINPCAMTLVQISSWSWCHVRLLSKALAGAAGVGATRRTALPTGAGLTRGRTTVAGTGAASGALLDLTFTRLQGRGADAVQS